MWPAERLCAGEPPLADGGGLCGRLGAAQPPGRRPLLRADGADQVPHPGHGHRAPGRVHRSVSGEQQIDNVPGQTGDNSALIDTNIANVANTTIY